MERKRHSMTDILFTLTLFCVFAVSALIVVVIGANVYRQTVHSMNENYTSRTAIAYVQEKVRENDALTSGDVLSAELCEFGETNALRLTRTGQNVPYYTYIYYADGALRELFVQDTSILDAAAGQVIAEVRNASFEALPNNLYCFTVTGENGTQQLLFVLHSRL